MNRVLVTGATGFIGRQTLPILLARGCEVHGVTMKTSTEQHDSVHWHETNLLDEQSTATLLQEVQPTHVLHFAWITEPGVYWESPFNRDWLSASKNLLSIFAENGGKRFVGAGTCAEYDWSNGHCIEGTTPLKPQTAYGNCKHALQEYLNTFDLNTAWGRIFYLYGPYEHPKRLVSSVILSLLEGKKAPCSHGKQIRDFLHVCDVADAFVSLLLSPVEGPVNIASGNGVPVRTVIETIAAQLHREDLIEWGAIAVAEGDPPSLTAETKRLREEVGWKPQYSLEEGIERTIEWWQQHLSSAH